MKRPRESGDWFFGGLLALFVFSTPYLLWRLGIGADLLGGVLP